MVRTALALLASVPAFAAAPLGAPTFDPHASLSPLVQAVDPAVVTIEVESTVTMEDIPPEMRPFLERFGMVPPDGTPHTQQGEGSGFVISADGLMLTNAHVVDGADGIHVVFSDGRKADATVVGTDDHIDVALLRLEGEGPWPYVALGDSDGLEVGDWVVAMGNGLGLGTTATFGIVSGKGRVIGHSVLGREEFIQTDAAINQGNSGGPLFGLDGKVVGMSTAIIQGANTVGFAIPSSLIASVLDDLEQTGHVARGYLGVSTQDLDDEVAAALGVKGTTKGAVVASVSDDAPAERSGIESGDVIIAIDGQPIDDAADLIDTISRREPGEKVTVKVARADKTKDLSVTLAERPNAAPGAVVSAPASPPLERGEGGAASAVGVQFAPLSPALAADAGVDHGVLVRSVTRGTEAEGRLVAGDIVLEVNRRPVTSVDELEHALARTPRPGTAFFLVARGEMRQFVALPLR
jgi:serine protease Do